MQEAEGTQLVGMEASGHVRCGTSDDRVDLRRMPLTSWTASSREEIETASWHGLETAGDGEALVSGKVSHGSRCNSGSQEEESVRLVGVEASGHGLETAKHAATLTKGSPGVLHGSFSFLLQDAEGQVIDPHSISAG